MRVGGSANSIALQPLCVLGQVGVSIAAGSEGLELRPGRYAFPLSPSLRANGSRECGPMTGSAKQSTIPLRR
ncbi:DUF992 domain-containing protein [Bradyrhizobium sp. 157]|nr:DUF992 domain-containing protein [Bradyrhizobium sp. 157]